MSTVWTPRPPSDYEPACWSWEIPPVLTVEERRQRHEAEQAAITDPDRKLSWEALQLCFLGGDPRMGEFHRDRCAICDRAERRGLVHDHCHDTGQSRGWLCRSCNIREGLSGNLPFARYRLWHPAAILDVHEMYTGMWWDRGWWIGDVKAGDAERPPTPWPAWDPSWAEEAS